MKRTCERVKRQIYILHKSSPKSLWNERNVTYRWRGGRCKKVWDKKEEAKKLALEILQSPQGVMMMVTAIESIQQNSLSQCATRPSRIL